MEKEEIKAKIAATKQKTFEEYVDKIYDHSEGEYKKIRLGFSLEFTTVDSKNYDYLVRLCRWYKVGSGYVVGRVKQEDGSFRIIPMHRVIMGNPPKHLEVDHVNQDKLLNTEENLRICTRQENSRNRKPFNEDNATSKYKGVSYHKTSDKWEGRITFEGKLYRIGLFANQDAAANAYNYFAEYLYGEYAHLNDCPYMAEEEWRSYVTGKQKYLSDVRK
jgi:hypothetical protein